MIHAWLVRLKYLGLGDILVRDIEARRFRLCHVTLKDEVGGGHGRILWLQFATLQDSQGCEKGTTGT